MWVFCLAMSGIFHEFWPSGHGSHGDECPNWTPAKPHSRRVWGSELWGGHSNSGKNPWWDGEECLDPLVHMHYGVNWLKNKVLMWFFRCCNHCNHLYILYMSRTIFSQMANKEVHSPFFWDDLFTTQVISWWSTWCFCPERLGPWAKFS